jgi:hypothetical protein
VQISHSEIPPPQCVEQQQAIAHLQALGYSESTPIYLRCFPQNKGSARNLQGTLADFPWTDLQQLQQQGYGVYFVANGQGHKDADVHEGRLIFFEHDNLEKAVQQELWKTLGLPVPTLQVDTGGKSIHSYWRLTLPCAVEQWRELQADFLEFADADRSIKNPSRVMRLAGFAHQSTGQMATIVSNSGQVYAYEELRAIVPRRGQPLSIVPLEVCLTRADRSLIQHGASAGQRNTCGAKLARNLIGTERYLQQQRQRYEGTARQLFEDYRLRCQPPLSPKEANQVWRRAEADNPTPSLTESAIANCIAAWVKQTDHKSSQQPSNVLPLRPAPTPEGTSEKIKALLQQGLSGTKLQAERIALRAQTTIPEREFNDLWQVSDRELQQQETRDETKADLDKLLEIGRYELGLKGILPDALAVPLERQSTLLGSTPAAMLLTLLPVVASLAKVGTKLELIQATGFYALPILYTGIICESGGAKSPTQKIILKPLLELQSDADRDYHQQFQDWEALALEANKKPPKPLPREYMTQDVTREAIGLIQSQQPDRGFIGWLDELSAIIGSQNQYRNGRGTDREALLTGRDGTGIKVNRASGKRIVSSVSAYSITGGTQPDTLRSLMGDFSDGSGQWARFLWCLMPIKRTPYPEPQDATISAQITAKLDQTYRRIEDFAPIIYKFTSKAQTLYHEWYDALDERRVQESRQSLRSVYAKAKGNTGELALLLHLTNAAIAGAQPAPQISVETLQAAIRVMKFCLGQVRLIHGLGDEMNGTLPPLLAKIIELSGRKGWITARDTKNGIRGLKATAPDQIRDMFSELVSMEHGEIAGVGIRVKFRAKAVDPVDTSSQPLSTGETLIYKQLQDTVDKIFDVSRNPALPSGLGNESAHLVSTVPTTSTASESLRPSGWQETVDTCRQPVSTAETPTSSQLQETVDTVDKISHISRNTAFPPFFLNKSTNSASTVPTVSTAFPESLRSQDLQPINASSTGCLQMSTNGKQAEDSSLIDSFPLAARRSSTASLNPWPIASTVSTTFVKNAEYPTGQGLQSVDIASTDCLQVATSDSQAEPVSLNALDLSSTASTAALEHAEFLIEQSLQVVDAVSTTCLQLSTDDAPLVAPCPPAADQIATADRNSVDKFEFAIGDRVMVNYLSTWQSATLIAIPNHHPHPSQRITGWKARLDTGQATYVWDIQNICPLNSEEEVPDG